MVYLSGLSTAMHPGDSVWAMGHNPTLTKINELSPHGMILTSMLLAQKSLESGPSGKVGIK